MTTLYVVSIYRKCLENKTLKLKNQFNEFVNQRYVSTKVSMLYTQYNNNAKIRRQQTGETIHRRYCPILEKGESIG
ncbi:hypothetical protein GCM10022218_42760 [Sphingobacterium ginsenosidimutans]|uniref:Uncharacterized protein n=1 Tax=Sphingobacterium ginsenosidimutans TaxID=687845 RepID=A0ABP8AGR6_9SPHI